jgi:aldehyde:ferredoxin oxidoreductase
MRHLMKHDESLELDRMAEAMSAATGVEYAPAALLEAGERIYNLERLFLIAAGFTKEDDNLPPRMLEEPMPDGPAKGQVVDLAAMLAEYYEHRGWDAAGVPRAETLARLKLA